MRQIASMPSAKVVHDQASRRPRSTDRATTTPGSTKTFLTHSSTRAISMWPLKVGRLIPRASALASTARGHIEIARVDEWVKNVFVLPGVVVALSVDRGRLLAWSWTTFALGMLAICLIA